MEKVDVRKAGDVVIVDFNGRLVVGDGAELLSEVLTELYSEGYRKVLLNFSNVDYIDSMTLGSLVQGYKDAQTTGASLRLLQPRDRVRKTLHLSQLLPLFQVYQSEQDAIEDFASPPPEEK